MAGGILGLFNRPAKKEEETHSSESGPIEIHTPKAPEYSASMGGLLPATIKFRGLYDLEGLYKFMANWLRQRRYEVHETMYKSKPPELEIRLYGERKHTGFVMWVITVYYHSWGEYDVDAVVNSKKKKMTNARMKLVLNGDVVAPYEDIFGRPRWTSNSIERRLLNLFRNWFMKRELESIEIDTLYYEMYKFHGAIKDFLKYEAKGNVY